MSSVTRLHLLSQSMLNVSCQKQKQYGSLPAESLAGRPMEFVGQPSPSGACNYLGVPGLISVDVDDDDEGDIVIGIRPKSSPLPRRKSSLSDEDSQPVPPLCGSRRVSFADARGLNLVQVKEFDIWDVPKLPEYVSPEGKDKDSEEYFISTHTFSLPLSMEELCARVRDQKVELETIELLPGTTILKGLIRVLNISFDKAVYIRTSLDSWVTHFDLLAEYIPGSSEGLMDCFSFKLTLVPPFGEQGARVDFCLRYETSAGTFWANNNNRNYVLVCHQRAKEEREKPSKETVKKKSCLKIVSQNFSTVEDISAMEASLQENKTDVSKHIEEVDTIKAKQISESQSGTSDEDDLKTLAKSKRNSSRRSRRKAARMARVRDYFAQRNGGIDAERDESPAGAEQTGPEEKRSDVETLSEGSSITQSSQLGLESLETSNNPLLDVLQNMSPAHDFTSNSQTQKSESINLADSSTLPRGESASDIVDNTLQSNDKPATAECQNLEKWVTRPEESSEKETLYCECKNNAALKAIQLNQQAAESSEGLVSQSNSFTFGTVVAPLYHQVFGKAGTENEKSADHQDPVKAIQDVEDFTETTEITQACAVVDKAQRNVDETFESSNQECQNASVHFPSMEEGTSLSGTLDVILVGAQTYQDSNEMQRCTNSFQEPKATSAGTELQPYTSEILDTDVLDPQTSTENADLQGEKQEDSLTPDLQPSAETEQAKPSEQTCEQTTTNFDGLHEQIETQNYMSSLEISCMPLEPSQSESEHFTGEVKEQSSSTKAKDDQDFSQNQTKSTTTNTSEDDTSSEAWQALKSNYVNDSYTEDRVHNFDSSLEILGEDVTTPQASPEIQKETEDVEEQNKEVKKSYAEETITPTETKVADEEVDLVILSDLQKHGDLFMELEDNLKLEEITVPGENENLNLGDFCSGDATGIKNWEMMVEEEEINIFIGEEESEEISLKAGDIEAVEEDHEEELEDERVEVALEKPNGDVAEKRQEKMKEELMWEIVAGREKKNNAAVTFVENQGFVEEEIWGIVAGKDREEVKKGNIPDSEIEKTPGEEAASCEAVLQKEKHHGEMEEVDTKQTTVPEGQGEEETDLKGGDKAGTEIETREENTDCNKDVLSKTRDTESKSTKMDDGENEAICFEEGLESTQKEVDGLSTLVNNVQEGIASEKENTHELTNSHLQTEIYEKADLKRNEKATLDLPMAEIDEDESIAAEGSSCIFLDDPDIDQRHHDASSESDSDDEVELYMHCLRAVHAGEKAQKSINKDGGFGIGKRPPVNRSKLLSKPMPSISESLDEDQNVGCLQENIADIETEDFQPSIAALPERSEQKITNGKISWWKETFSCSGIGKAFLFATLFLVFLVVAYHYDFLACFGLYLMSLVWLWFQGEKQPVKSRKRIG